MRIFIRSNTFFDVIIFDRRGSIDSCYKSEPWPSEEMVVGFRRDGSSILL